MFVLWNDQIIERSEVNVDIEDRGYQFGEGIYEAIRVYHGEMFMVQEHLDRLWRSAAKINMTLPFTQEELRARLSKLVEMTEITEGKIYFQVTRGNDSPRAHIYPDPQKVPPVLTGTLYPFDRPVEKQEQGLQAGFVEDKRWLHCDIKSTSLLGNTLSLDEAMSKGYDDAILVRDGVITECSASNFWIVKDQILYTHPNGELVLPGITKVKVAELAEQLGLEIQETTFGTEEVLASDECFASNSIQEIVPIVAVEGQKIGEGTRGPITEKLQKAYIQATEKF